MKPARKPRRSRRPAAGARGEGRDRSSPSPGATTEILPPAEQDLEEADGASDVGSGPATVPGPVSRYDALGAYIREVRKYPELTREEEIELAGRYRGLGDRAAARRLVVSNLSLVVKIALVFRRAVANALDLIQEGNLGLLQAVEKFDPALGVRFRTYAAWWIKAYILKYLLDNARMVRVGTTNARRRLIYNLTREKARLDALGFATGPKLLAEHFGVSEQDVIDVQATLEAGDVALDAPLADEPDARSRIDQLRDGAEPIEEQVARRQLQQILEAKIEEFRRTLGKRERAILDGRLLAESPETLQAIGEKFSITREAVRLTEEKLLARLKEYLRAELGEDVLLQFRR